MAVSKTWGIIGLGWLGQSLCQKVQDNGSNCWGTNRSDFTFGRDKFPGKACDILFLNTPPLKSMSAEEYVDEIKATFSTKVIFISSVSIFGSDQRECSEVTDVKPRSVNGKWLATVEKLMTEKFKSNFLTIRPGGLIGEKRHPVKFFSSDQKIPGGNNPINLIHRNDLIKIIIEANRLDLKGVLNAVAPYHPKKSEYYTEWARMLNLPPLKFKDETTSTKKIESIYLSDFYSNWECEKLNTL